MVFAGLCGAVIVVVVTMVVTLVSIERAARRDVVTVRSVEMARWDDEDEEARIQARAW